MWVLPFGILDPPLAISGYGNWWTILARITTINEFMMIERIPGVIVVVLAMAKEGLPGTWGKWGFFGWCGLVLLPTFCVVVKNKVFRQFNSPNVAFNLELH